MIHSHGLGILIAELGGGSVPYNLLFHGMLPNVREGSQHYNLHWMSQQPSPYPPPKLIDSG
jgi:hypothetical protein